MQIPRWLMCVLCALIAMAVPAAVALWWLLRPGPDLAGSWMGPGWGAVEMRRSEEGVFEGIYTSTYGQDVGRIKVFWSSRTRSYEGTWSEGTYRFGRVSLRVRGETAINGVYSADPNCMHEPGDPVRQEFQWSRDKTAEILTVRSLR